MGLNNMVKRAFGDFQIEVRDILIRLFEEKYEVAEWYGCLVIQDVVHVRINENNVSINHIHQTLDRIVFVCYSSPSFIDDVLSTVQDMIVQNK